MNTNKRKGHAMTTAEMNVQVHDAKERVRAMEELVLERGGSPDGYIAQARREDPPKDGYAWWARDTFRLDGLRRHLAALIIQRDDGY